MDASMDLQRQREDAAQRQEMLKVLESHELTQCFRQYLKATEHAKLLSFWSMLQVLKKSDGPSALVAGQNLYDQFLKTGAATFMAGALVQSGEKLAAELKVSSINAATLNEIEIAALDYMSREVLPGFRSSDEFQSHAAVCRASS
jgi:hypothetical protein